MKDVLELLQSLLSLLFLALGSAAFLKYLLPNPSQIALPQSSPGKRIRASRETGTPKAEPIGTAPEHTAPEPVSAASAAAHHPPQAHVQPPKPPAPVYPRNPPHGIPILTYEVANPGLKRSDGFPLQLQPSSCGILLACRVHSAICVYVQPGLEDDASDLKRQYLSQLYDLYDPSGAPLQTLPRGFLRISNLQPALCAEYGANLTLLAKGRVSVTPAGTPV